MKSSFFTGFMLCVLSVFIMMEAFKEAPVPDPVAKNRKVVFCAPSFSANQLKTGKAPIIKGLGRLHYPVTTEFKEAQRYFNQGLTLIYAFNHGEAARSFQQVLRIDSTLAMGWWGMAMVLGPNYNAALNPSSLEEIQVAMKKAVQYAAAAGKKEQVLIDALAKRFPAAAVPDMAPYHAAYAKAMKAAHEQYPGDADIAVLYVDALMNEHPWNLYQKDGTPQPWTPAIEQLLEKTISENPTHPGALHLYIHAVEASRTAHRGLPAARRLLHLLPAAGHLVHMPAHIYIRTGHYHEGVLATEKARWSDSNYIDQCRSQGTYPLLYYPHNIHFLAACAFLEGNSRKAIEAAWGVARQADRRYLDVSGTVQHYSIIPFHVLVHLARWQEVLALPAPASSLPYPRAVWHYARGMALVAQRRLQEAELELNKVQAYANDESLRQLLVWETNSALDLVSIAALTLEGELLSAGRQYDAAVDVLRKAVAAEDKLNYQEPPDWFFSVRHTLGHVLLQASRFAEATQVFQEDLHILPENGWALMGLYQSLQRAGRNKEAMEVKERFRKAWQWADIEITSSRKY